MNQLFQEFVDSRKIYGTELEAVMALAVLIRMYPPSRVLIWLKN
jgi:hypothetical protein